MINKYRHVREALDSGKNTFRVKIQSDMEESGEKSLGRVREMRQA